MSKVKAIAFPAPLKAIHDAIVTANPNSTVTPKTMRVKLRAKPPYDHSHNGAWIAENQKQYDAIRSMFDPAYAAKVAKPPRAARKPKVTEPTT